MFQRIDEKVDIIGIYTQGHFFPKKMKWKTRVFQIEEITLVSEIRDGEVKKRLYSFRTGKDLYRLLFNRDTEIWILEEVWVE